MRAGQLEELLTRNNTWWRSTETRTWDADDPDLRGVKRAPFCYLPDPLHELVPEGLYVLSGPRRVGKSVEIKRAIRCLLERGVDRRRIIHAACDGWRRRDLLTLLDVAAGLAPPSDGPRYLFLDEITGVVDDWVSQLKWMRDNTALRDDCVVISGSSCEYLERARGELAGRRGPISHPDRTLLPMGFKAFCLANNIELPVLPVFHPRELLEGEAAKAIYELRPFLMDIVTTWERYLLSGGFPRAVADWIEEREVSEPFLRTLWDVIHRDALKAANWSSAQTQTLLEEIARALTAPFNVADAARDLGKIHHETVENRLTALTQNYILWPCYQNQNNRPKLRSQRKLYFLDPLHARLAALRKPANHPPDFTQLTEQQIGVALLRSIEHHQPGSLADHDLILFVRTATRKEIDFTGEFLGRVPYESKYTEGGWLKEAATANAAFSRGVFATRNIIERVDDLLALPAGFIALLIDPTPRGAMTPLE